mmetsp:Transcript_88097/g.156195  ORF Transcript_88097/g.156195 Transcript_88097/m.156195 type:complete len:189 (-) Transcript_88097:184-750(-)|eukprot:CAMPEP_0197653458 /NCGR_PEP_ID=MMETSP1338-20131121/35594_1 /TAXON_ID=43686 ORGANISM="Pelagodinium beii, Strain RCC1491" /NCGR_SAMPLE_ID=MMETSP1338 /ASSEMBLY_ACC=CAM_ASM_000754 /LENGTH=188 /DNA_ID=CAMNT_0043228577 /DNA_START=58 /DNA_END=624 /DNA_ORIENTATION=-
MTNRASSTLAIPPLQYTTPKSAFWKGTQELERFPPTYQEADEVFEEYLENKSLSPSRHVAALKSSSGLMELHYDTMRKRARERANHPVQKAVPTMDRAYSACSGYSGLIPGKISGNIVGCTFMDGSKLSSETRGKFFDAPMSGVTYTLGGRSRSSPSLHGATSPTSTLSQAGQSALSPSSPMKLSIDV